METGPQAVEDGMANEWYCNMSGDVSGPLTDAQLKELAGGGHLSPNDLVRKTAGGEWVAARRVNGLFAAGGARAETGQKVRAATPTEGRPDARLPVAKAVGGPPPVAPTKPMIRQLGTAPRGGPITVDAAKSGASVRSRSRKRLRRLIASPSVLAVSVAGIVLGGVIFWLSRTETQPVRADEDTSITEAGPDRPGSSERRNRPSRSPKATADAIEGLDMDQLNRPISTPLDGPKPASARTDVKNQLAGPDADKLPEDAVPADEPVAPAEPDEPETLGPRETMVGVLEDDGYSPIPIPGLTDVDNADEAASRVRGIGEAKRLDEK